MRIGLVPDIPDQLVLRRVEHIMDRNRKLDHAKPRAQMSAGLPDRLQHILAHFIGKGAQLAHV